MKVHVIVCCVVALCAASASCHSAPYHSASYHSTSSHRSTTSNSAAAIDRRQFHGSAAQFQSRNPLPGFQSRIPKRLPADVLDGIPEGLLEGVSEDVLGSIPTRVSKDVPAGVPAGVPAVVPAVVPSGFPAGVSSGVPAIVPADVPSGVTSGVPAGVPAAVPASIPTGFLETVPAFDPDLREVGCPVPEDILPCTCLISVVNTTYLRCSDLESGDQLEQVFLADFPDPEIAYLHIENSPFLRTIGDIFNGKSIFQMDIYDSGLEYISEYAFIDSLDTLEVLLISNSYLHESTFPFYTLNLYSRLNSLYLYTTQIEAVPALTSDSLMYVGVTDSLLTTIAADTFQGLSQLTQIFLLHNSIATLETGAFRNIPSLRHVDLSVNALTYLESGTFPMADGTMSINLNNNSIAVAEPGTFVMPDTTLSFSVFINFAYNQLTVVDEGVFGALFPYLSYLYLDGNPLECGCDVTWLITTPNWTQFVGSYAACADGVMLVDLDPQYYVDNC